MGDTDCIAQRSFLQKYVSSLSIVRWSAQPIFAKWEIQIAPRSAHFPKKNVSSLSIVRWYAQPILWKWEMQIASRSSFPQKKRSISVYSAAACSANSREVGDTDCTAQRSFSQKYVSSLSIVRWSAQSILGKWEMQIASRNSFPQKYFASLSIVRWPAQSILGKREIQITPREQTFRAAHAPVRATICNDARNALRSCPQNGNMFWYHILL